MKLLKALFSRITLFVILILLQVAIITLVIYFTLTINHLGYGVVILLFILEIVVFLVVLNRNDAPDMKIPWIVFIFALPIVGVLCFLLFGNHGMSNKQYATLKARIDALLPYYTLKDCPKEENLVKNNPEYAGIVRYLDNVNDLKGYDGNKITYFKNGETFFPDMISKLKEAESFIFMEFFIVDYGKEWDQIFEVLKEKAKAGVQVKFMYDDFGSVSTVKRSFVKTLRKAGINCIRFNEFKPVLSGVFNNRDHRKICVIDHKYGYTGGINLADEYANEKVRFGYWKDSMVRIEGPAIHNLILMFLLVFDSIRKESSNYQKLIPFNYVKKGDAFVYPFGDGPKPYNNENVGEQTFINLFNAAKKTIYISSPYLIPTHALMQAMRTAAFRGVDIRLIVPGIPDKKLVYLMAKNNFRNLLDAGVKIYTFTPGFNHEKAIVIDDQIAFCGTINLDYRSLIHHFECGAIFYNTDAVKDLSNSLKETMDKSAIVPLDFKLGFWKSLLAKVISLFTPLL